MKSSKVNALGYDPEIMTLRVEFSTGALYDYMDVPPEKFDAMMAADSIGTYMGVNIIGPDRKNPLYNFSKVGAPGATQAATRAVAAQKDAVDARLAAQAATHAAQSPVLPVSATPEELPTDQEGLKQRAMVVKGESSHLVKVDERQRTILIVDSAESYEAICQLLIRRNVEKKRAQARVDEFKKPAYAAYQAALALEREIIGAYDAAIGDIDRALTTYRQDAQARAREAARLEQEANQRRLDAEANQRAREASERAIVEASNMRAAGQHEVAAEIERAPEPIVRQVAPSPVHSFNLPQVAGTAVRGTWRFVIQEPTLVPRFFSNDVVAILHKYGITFDIDRAGSIAQDLARAFNELYTLDETKIGAKVRALKEGAQGLIPGVSVDRTEKTGTTGR